MLKATVIILGGLFIFCFIFYRTIKFECNMCSSCKCAKKITPVHTVLTVKNNEDCIEGVIYSLIKEIQINRNMPLSPDIVVVDLGSLDATIKILEKLSQKYEFIHILHSNSHMDISAS